MDLFEALIKDIEDSIEMETLALAQGNATDYGHYLGIVGLITGQKRSLQKIKALQAVALGEDDAEEMIPVDTTITE